MKSDQGTIIVMIVFILLSVLLMVQCWVFYSASVNSDLKSTEANKKVLELEDRLRNANSKEKEAPQTNNAQKALELPETSPPQLFYANEIQKKIKKITPAHNIWMKWDKLKSEMSASGWKERERRTIEEEAERKQKEEAAKVATALAERLAAKRAEEDKERAKAAEVKAEQDRKEAEKKRLEEERAAAKRKAEEQRLAEQRRIEGEKRKAAEPVDLITELRKSGFYNQDRISYDFHRVLNDFTQYGNDRLKDKLDSAESHPDMYDPFKKADAEARVRAVEAEITVAQTTVAQKTFLCEYIYQASDVKVYGNESSCKITIWTSFSDRLVNVNPSFPVPGIVVNSKRSGNSFMSGGFLELSVTGSTANIEELVRNCDNYRAKVQFKNLRRGDSYIANADVLKIEIVKK